MNLLRIEKRHARPARRELEMLPLDPRDPDILRAKRAISLSAPAASRRVSARSNRVL